MLLFCSRFYLLWKRRLIYCFLADSSVSYGGKTTTKTKKTKKNKTKKHDCNITKLIVRLCSGKTLTMLSMCVGLLEKAWLKSQSHHFSRLMTKPTKCLCNQRRLRSAWASAQSDQSLRCTRSAWASAQSDQSLCCPHEESLGL